MVVAMHVRLLSPLPLGAAPLPLPPLLLLLLLLRRRRLGGAAPRRRLRGIFNWVAICCRWHRWLDWLRRSCGHPWGQLGVDEQRGSAQVQPADASRLGSRLLRHPRLLPPHQGCAQQRRRGRPVLQVGGRAAAGCCRHRLGRTRRRLLLHSCRGPLCCNRSLCRELADLSEPLAGVRSRHGQRRRAGERVNRAGEGRCGRRCARAAVSAATPLPLAAPRAQALLLGLLLLLLLELLLPASSWLLLRVVLLQLPQVLLVRQLQRVVLCRLTVARLLQGKRGRARGGMRGGQA